MRRTGTADLPLHGGRAPAWLFGRMTRLAAGVTEALVLEGGPAEVLRRIGDPFWFQAFGCLLGFDWHSSGVTTTVCGAMKAGLAGRERDVGLLVAGGKGAASRRTPAEIERWGARTGVEPGPLAYASRMAAKVDSAAVQDGFTLYHHAFFATATGEWAVVQQGMRDADRTARRYHWRGEEVGSFVEEPHAAVCGGGAEDVLNFVARESSAVRSTIPGLAREEPERLLRELAAAGAMRVPRRHGRRGDDLRLPRRHGITAADLSPSHLRTILLRTYEEQPGDFERLLGTRGLGARTLRALNLLSELLYGSAASTRDPATFSFAHGGKDGTPHPVDRETYDRTIDHLASAVANARAGRSEKLAALRRLRAMARISDRSHPASG
ncbi:MAG TPA: DUF763 domain-containing protein [Gemmatimonadota bacterium]|jgi:hypothetical protein